MGEEKIKVLIAENVRLLVDGMNKARITKDRVVTIINNDGQFFVIYE